MALIEKNANLDASIGLSEANASDYIALLKPRVMSLVVFTGFVGMMAAPGQINPVLAAIAILCIAVGAGASGALNMWYDADIDAIMKRTSKRPIPAGRISRGEVLTFGLLLSAFSVVTLGLFVNLLVGISTGVHDLLLCCHLYDVAEAIDAAEHRYRRSSGCVSTHDRLGGGHEFRQHGKHRPFSHHLPVDAAAFLGLVALHVG